jgi:hypothetical protein
MAVPLANKLNVEAPSAGFPFGNIKDNPGDNSGTAVNKAVYADLHQFFAKMFAESGLAYNNLPESATDGFQYFQALLALFGGLRTKIVQIGDWNMDTTNLVEIAHGLDWTKIVNVHACIYADGGGDRYMLVNSETTPVPTGTFSSIISWTALNIALRRATGGVFDSASFSGTPFNRGFIVIQYVA